MSGVPLHPRRVTLDDVRRKAHRIVDRLFDGIAPDDDVNITLNDDLDGMELRVAVPHGAEGDVPPTPLSETRSLSMTDKRIEPALTPEQWAHKSVRMPPPTRLEQGAGDWDVALTLHGENALMWEYMSEHCEREIDLRPIPALIAFANAALPDSDPRKITREHVRLLREKVSPDGIDRVVTDEEYEAMRRTQSAIDALADALESYLPPEER